MAPAMRGCVLLLLMGPTACTSWAGRAGVLNHPLTSRDQVRLWVQGQAFQVHGVRVVGDSVLVVPFIQPPQCDSCVLRFATREVDSVQVRHLDGNKSLLLAVALSPLIYVVVWAIALGGSGGT